MHAPTTEKFNIAPTPRFLLGFANQNWSASGAIAELVDNSFGAIRGNAKRVEIVYDSAKKLLTVFDTGAGMKRIGALFQLGNTVGMSPADIGRYGCGGTMALMWLATSVDIWTMRQGKFMSDRIVWKNVMNARSMLDVFVNDGWATATATNTPAKLLAAGHGTYIEMHVRPERSINTASIQQEIARLYAPALRHGKTIHWTTLRNDKKQYSQVLEDKSLVLPRDPKLRIDFDITLEVDGKHLPVHGSVGIIHELPFSQSFISIGFGSRVIMQTRDCYTSADGKTRYSGSGVAGWLDLGDGWQSYLSTTKNEVNDDRVRIVLMHHVFTEIEPLLKKTEDDRLSLILDDIALELQDAINGLGDSPIELRIGTSTPKRGDRNPPDPRDPGEPPPPTPTDRNRKAKNSPDETLDGDLATEKPSVCQIRIARVSDEAINGNLCRMKVLHASENNFAIEVNKDHKVVCDILKSRPPNKVAFHLLLTRELASAFARHPALLERALPIKVSRQLKRLETDIDREWALARILIDKTRSSK